jgi:hypothetical protein
MKCQCDPTEHQAIAINVGENRVWRASHVGSREPCRRLRWIEMSESTHSNIEEETAIMSETTDRVDRTGIWWADWPVARTPMPNKVPACYVRGAQHALDRYGIDPMKDDHFIGFLTTTTPEMRLLEVSVAMAYLHTSCPKGRYTPYKLMQAVQRWAQTLGFAQEISGAAVELAALYSPGVTVSRIYEIVSVPSRTSALRPDSFKPRWRAL